MTPASGPPPRADSAAPSKQLDRAGGGATSAAPSEALPAPGVAPIPPPGRSGFAPGQRERRIERSASLTLAAPEDRLDRVADGINRLTERYDGLRAALLALERRRGHHGR